MIMNDKLFVNKLSLEGCIVVFTKSNFHSYLKIGFSVLLDWIYCYLGVGLLYIFIINDIPIPFTGAINNLETFTRAEFFNIVNGIFLLTVSLRNGLFFLKKNLQFAFGQGR